MLPYYHPTSVVVVDDDVSFLESFQFYYGDQFLCRPFQRAGEALEFLRAPANLKWFRQDFIAPAHGAMDPHGFERGDRIVQVKTSLVTNVFADPERFARPSVVVVDYAMPGMSGIDFLKQIADLPVRKLLLTGKGDEKTAVSAFNEGIIDAFFMKQQPGITDTLSRRLAELQVLYFTHATRMLSSTLALEMTDFVNDQAFDRALERIIESHATVEFCILTEPTGVLLLRSDGRPELMLVADEEQIKAASEIARAENAPDELIARLEAGQSVSLFPTRTGYYEPQFAGNWQRYVWQGTPIDGSRRWLYTVLPEPLFVPTVGRSLRTFDAYRAALDA
jgi:CheY-like chemotaxis protein